MIQILIGKGKSYVQSKNNRCIANRGVVRVDTPSRAGIFARSRRIIITRRHRRDGELYSKLWVVSGGVQFPINVVRQRNRLSARDNLFYGEHIDIRHRARNNFIGACRDRRRDDKFPTAEVFLS